MQRPQQETEGIVNRPIAAELQVTGKLISQIRPIAEKGRGCWLYVSFVRSPTAQKSDICIINE